MTGKAAAGTGNGQTNDIVGNLYANRLDGAGGADILTGGDGNDTYYIDVDGDDVVETNAGAKGGIDLIVSMVDYALGANEENLTLDAKGAGELATGNGLKNVLTGNGLDNTLDGGADNDRMSGGAGDDTYTVDSTGDIVTESLKGAAGGTDHVDSKVSFTLGANLEDLTLLDDDNVAGTGNGLDNEIEGNDGNNKLSGLAGADTLDGDDGNDTLDGGAGADKMDGGNGDDIYVQDNAGDLITEAGKDSGDELRTNQARTDILAGIEHYTFLGAAALDFTADGAANRIAGNKGADKIDGGDGNDTLAGNGGNDTLTGGNDNDSLDGGVGNDSLIGGAGDDIYVVNSAGDKISDGGGSDSVQSAVTFTLAPELENLQLTGTAASTAPAMTAPTSSAAMPAPTSSSATAAVALWRHDRRPRCGRQRHRHRRRRRRHDRCKQGQRPADLCRQARWWRCGHRLRQQYRRRPGPGQSGFAVGLAQHRRQGSRHARRDRGQWPRCRSPRRCRQQWEFRASGGYPGRDRCNDGDLRCRRDSRQLNLSPPRSSRPPAGARSNPGATGGRSRSPASGAARRGYTSGRSRSRRATDGSPNSTPAR